MQSYFFSDFTGANHIARKGQVEIAFLVECSCEFLCIFKDVENKQFVCYCPPNYILAEDNVSCRCRYFLVSYFVSLFLNKDEYCTYCTG